MIVTARERLMMLVSSFCEWGWCDTHHVHAVGLDELFLGGGRWFQTDHVRALADSETIPRVGGGPRPPCEPW